MTWVDDFATDRFADATYTVLGGASAPIIASGTATVDGLSGWVDERAPSLVIDTHLQILAGLEPFVLALGLSDEATTVAALVELGAAFGAVWSLNVNGALTTTAFTYPAGDWTLHFTLDSAGLMTASDGLGQTISLTLTSDQFAALGTVWPAVICYAGAAFGGLPAVFTLWSYDTGPVPPAPGVEIAGQATVGRVEQGTVRA